VSLKRILGKTLVYLVLEVGALCGVPMRPDEIEKIMKMSEPQVTQVARSEEGDGEEPKVEP
jgi:hypothetical protein